jgi:hypothetical protein
MGTVQSIARYLPAAMPAIKHHTCWTLDRLSVFVSYNEEEDTYWRWTGSQVCAQVHSLCKPSTRRTVTL